MWHPQPVRRACAATLLLAGGVAGCAERPPQPAPGAGGHAAVDTAAVRATIDSLRGAWEAGVAAGNYASMGTLLADGAVMVQPGGPGWDSLATAAAGAPFPPGTTIDITPLEVRGLGPEWAYEFGTSAVTYTPAGSTAARQLSDTYLILFRKTPGGWKVFREVASSKAPPTAASPVR
jgi:ketosteroid isomerase-like protein